MVYKRLTDNELADFLQRACVQLVPELTQQLLSLGMELTEYRTQVEQRTLIDIEDVAKVFDKIHGAPCDYGMDGEEVIDVILGNTDYGWCERNCVPNEHTLCWEEYIKAKLKELQNG